MLSYCKKTAWHGHTHCDDQDIDFINDTIDKYELKPNFQFYDVNTFVKTQSRWNKDKSLSIFHTNVCSIEANNDKLEDLLFDLTWNFDIVALSET